MPTLLTGEIASRVNGVLHGDPNVMIRSVADAKSATEGEITFAEEARFLELAAAGEASAILLPKKLTPPSGSKVYIQVENARVGFAKLLEIFHPEEASPSGVDPSALVDPSASVDPTAAIGPGCVIGANATIGARTELMAGNHVGTDSSIGDDCKLFPNAVLYPRSRVGCRVRIHAGTVVGSDGYGYVFDGTKHMKIPQIGGVVIEDDVELGANVTIDRGALGDTKIGQGTKIDNLVQIAHNVVIGKHCIIISQTGIAGSTSVGDFTIIAGQVGIAGHLKIGSQVTIAAQSGVMRDIPDGQKVFGSPAQSDRDYKRQLIGLQQLPDLIKRFRRFEKNRPE